ncbi:MAG: bifunctional adenosylcobinamide kinase/adenosylcobinamide-phosphate guanylyltransferase [Bacteroidetes bacterium]|nr:bifunctional adenosylcobinamide kinase/adenosylcobinamide-phosphate guanylyltransferase [Bacteroidota bacterium]
MAKIIFITGGQRSGKSSFAQKLAKDLSSSPYYLATARVLDAEFASRVKRHQADRDDSWKLIEEDTHLSQANIPPLAVVVVDCITLWLTNLFIDMQDDMDTVLSAAKKEWDAFTRKDITIIAVSNEIGMGVIPANAEARKFADLQGFMNQYIAGTSDETFLMVSGLPLTIKS